MYWIYKISLKFFISFSCCHTFENIFISMDLFSFTNSLRNEISLFFSFANELLNQVFFLSPYIHDGFGWSRTACLAVGCAYDVLVLEVFMDSISLVIQEWAERNKMNVDIIKILLNLVWVAWELAACGALSHICMACFAIYANSNKLSMMKFNKCHSSCWFQC